MDQPRVAGAEVQMGAAYQAAGSIGLQLLKAAIVSIVTVDVERPREVRLVVRFTVFRYCSSARSTCGPPSDLSFGRSCT